MKNNILTVLMLLCIACPLSAQYTAGSGTTDDPFQISSMVDLHTLSGTKGDWFRNFILTEDLDASETRNIVNENGDTIGFTPIGMSLFNDEKFIGTFDGQGHTISNLYINSLEEENAGLFGYFAGTLKNLNIDNATVSGDLYVGILMGYGDRSAIISDCKIDGHASGNINVGIACGYSKSNFTRVTTSGTVKGTENVGGFIGAASLGAGEYYDIYACSTSATVKGTENVGGFSGLLKAGVRDCYANSTVTGDETTGGFVGLFDGSGLTMQGCFSLSTVEAKANVGGLIGIVSAGTITNCYANSEVVASEEKSAGGFMGNFISSASVFKDNFYNKDVSNVTYDDIVGITAISNVALATESTFSEWDFDQNWEMVTKEELSATALPFPKAHLYDYHVDFATTIPEAGKPNKEGAWLNEGNTFSVECPTPSDPYLFKGWYLDGVLISSAHTLNITANDHGNYTAFYYVPYSGGEGTKESPYQLSTLDDFILLDKIPTDYNKYFELKNDIDFSASRNITNEDGDTVGFDPIGELGAEFEGHINGNNYSITNMYINRPDESNIGLLGFTSKATVIDLSIKDCYIIGYSKVGPLVGDGYSIFATRCFTDGYCQALEVAGGMCGTIRGEAVLSDCHASTDVVTIENCTGGLVGNHSAELFNCSASGNVTGVQFVGGLIGISTGNSQYCIADATVIGRYCIGGYAGSLAGQCRRSFSHSSVTQTPIGQSGDVYGYVGGFTGLQDYGYVTECYAFGLVTGVSNEGGFYGGKNPYGISIDPENCYFDKETTNQRNRRRSGVTALKTEDFADPSNFTEWDFDSEWEIGTVEAYDSNPRPYTPSALGYEFFVSAITSNEGHGEVDTLTAMAWYKDGGTATVKASAKNGYRFEGWYLDDMIISSDSVFNFTVEKSYNLIAQFERTPLAFAGGNGSLTDPYQISNFEQLSFLASHLDILYGRAFILINDIDASASETVGYNVTGSYMLSFIGKLDGQGYTINNLHITQSNDDRSTVGLFAVLSGEVKNVIMKNVHADGANQVGAIAGKLDGKGRITGCTVIDGEISGDEAIGGIAGMTYETRFGSKVHISDCRVEGTVISGIEQIGGLVGHAQGEILNSSTACTVHGSNYVGGLVGISSAISFITRSSTNSIVTGSTAVGGFAGGVTENSEITRSYSLSDVTATDIYAGGFVGKLTSSAIVDCYSIGNVKALDNVGGFIGNIGNSANIKNCYSTQTLDVVGMFTGAFFCLYTGNNGEISDCYYNSETTNGIDSYYSSGCTDISISGLSNDEFADENTFTDFDFTSTWKMRVDTTIDEKSRPYLKWQTATVEVTIDENHSNVATVLGAGSYEAGETIKVSAELVKGWKFTCWKNKKEIVSTEATYEFIGAKDSTYTLHAFYETNFSPIGEGTTSNPFHIKTMDHLCELSNLPTYWGKHYILDNNIDASSTDDLEIGFATIGTEVFPFTGTFDGKNHTIYDLYINGTTTSRIFNGMFGFTKGATISNLTLENLELIARGYAGGLIGATYSNSELDEDLFTVVRNCHIKGSIIEGGNFVGSLIGSLYTGDVFNSTATDVTVTGVDYVGGLLGEAIGAITIDSCEVKSCTVTALSNNIGGFVGRSAGALITNCTAEATTSGDMNVGGFVGNANNYSIIKNCSATGVSKATGTFPIVGGFIGSQYYSRISNCFATGDVDCSDLYGGGFVGYTSGSIGTIIEESYSTGNVLGRRYIGGFAGAITSTVRFCYSTGFVDATKGGTVESDDVDVQFGGFAGRISSGAQVSNSYTLSDVKGHKLTGGFSGVNQGIVENCYAANEIETTGDYAAGFSSYTEESESAYLENCYFDRTLNNLDGVAIGNSKATGLTTAQFASESNMDLPFQGIWEIRTNDLDPDNPRPYLKNNGTGTLLLAELENPYAAELDGIGWFDTKEEVTLTISNIQSGFVFSHWEANGTIISSENPYTFEYQRSDTLIAFFNENNIIAKGDGSVSAPYEISTLDELICMSNISSIWNKHFVLANDIDAKETKYINLMSGFSPIGVDDSTRFTGSFDGLNHTISNLYINRINGDNAQGLFGSVGNALNQTTIKNVTLDSAFISGQYGVGALVGDMMNTKLENCTAKGYVYATGSYIGGLVGRSMEQSTITRCSYDGRVFAPSSSDAVATGGLVGYNLNSNIEYSYALTDSILSYGESVGGLVGYNHNTHNDIVEEESSISYSFAISGLVYSQNDNVGGLVGTNNEGYIRECYTAAPVTLNSEFGYNKGPIAGIAFGGELVSIVFDKNLASGGSMLDGIGVSTTRFAEEDAFKDWDFVNNWKMAYGKGKTIRPYLSHIGSHSVTFKTEGSGELHSEGFSSYMNEITNDVIDGFDSRTVRAIPNVGFSLKQWTVENQGPWDNENISTYVSGEFNDDIVIVAEFEKSTGLSDISAEDLVVYPNPADDFIYVEGFDASTQVAIINTTGQQVYAGLYNKGISVANLPNGVYIIQINKHDNVIRTSFIKQ